MNLYKLPVIKSDSFVDASVRNLAELLIHLVLKTMVKAFNEWWSLNS